MWFQRGKSPFWQGGMATGQDAERINGNSDKTITLEACPQRCTSSSKVSLLKGSITSSNSAPHWRPVVAPLPKPVGNMSQTITFYNGFLFEKFHLGWAKVLGTMI